MIKKFEGCFTQRRQITCCNKDWFWWKMKVSRWGMDVNTMLMEITMKERIEAETHSVISHQWWQQQSSQDKSWGKSLQNYYAKDTQLGKDLRAHPQKWKAREVGVLCIRPREEELSLTRQVGHNLAQPIANKIRFYSISHEKPFAPDFSDTPHPISQGIKLALSSNYIRYPTQSYDFYSYHLVCRHHGRSSVLISPLALLAPSSQQPGASS